MPECFYIVSKIIFDGADPCVCLVQKLSSVVIKFDAFVFNQFTTGNLL